MSGRIVEQTETTITIDVGGGVISVPATRVERIVKGRTPLDEYDERAAHLGAEDADGWRSLGLWASQQGLGSQARQAYHRVLKLAPDDAEARRALGYVRLGGRWMTEEESYPLLGYVLYDGEWMVPADAELARQEDAAEDERAAAEQLANEEEIAAMQAADEARWAEEQMHKDDEEQRDAEEEGRYDVPVYWGSWGYGVTYWPSTPSRGDRPANRPARPPARVPR